MLNNRQPGSEMLNVTYFNVKYPVFDLGVDNLRKSDTTDKLLCLFGRTEKKKRQAVVSTLQWSAVCTICAACHRVLTHYVCIASRNGSLLSCLSYGCRLHLCSDNETVTELCYLRSTACMQGGFVPSGSSKTLFMERSGSAEMNRVMKSCKM